ncbi:UDP-N-acetylmuramate dehydrogenase [Thalassotalea mangrovi]|uniref:UDP-N-acetylenolpyruvoylglucosamine reductase n=1 Tax=Thalassotalea mangrovi TaxID=2572245 RepID=A0A4U1B504_9GAMM|nr:UDP-N-acetylmuramate dehydrogenase [Thalassotalea mangrovi]TKB45490.1 UDP-N-acetylmuramate dehydrogenase [Thalassotalea mangrovi]
MTATNNSLQSLSTFALPAMADTLIHLDQPEQLSTIDFQSLGAFYVLGGGSNSIFLKDYSGTIIQPDFKGIVVDELEHSWMLHVAAGENWHQLVCYCLERNMPGLENLALIPGNCGAAPIQNIGAYGVELAKFCQYVDWFEIATGNIRRLSLQECQFGYRDSVFKHALKNKGIIVAIGLELPKQWQPELSYPGLSELHQPTPKQVFDTVVAIRQSKLPNPDEIPNVGSFFKNPVVDKQRYQRMVTDYPGMPAFPQPDGLVKLAAGWLIDQCGLKGKKIGGAAVHHRQALVLTNVDNCNGQDLLDLANHVRSTVYETFAITLEPEVRLIGQTGEITLEPIV